MKKLLTILLSALLALSLAVPALATTPMVNGQIVTVKTAAPDLTGKTVILHSNDVHGALAGYAYMPALKAAYEAAGADVIVIEANHDVRMLQTGSYPYYLKQRILGDRGHLSNENSGKLLSRILADRTKFIFLGHLSHENNLPELAYEAVRAEITMGDNPYRAEDFRIMIAKRDEPSPIVTL